MPFEPGECSLEHGEIDLIDLGAFADTIQQGDGQIAADVFCEFV